MRWAIVASVLCAGCAAADPARVPDPAVVARALGRALGDGDPRAAHALLHPQARDAADLAAFTARFADARAELREAGRMIASAKEPPRAQARVQLADGAVVLLALDRGRWRIDAGVLDTEALATPLDAVATLRKALLRRSLPALLRVLSRERRGELDARRKQLISDIEDQSALVVEERGETAVVRSAEGAELLHLRREAGQWRVQDAPGR